MWIVGPYHPILPKHFRVGRVVLFVVAGELRLEGGRAAPFHLGLGSLQFGRTPIVFMDEGGAILVDAHCSANIAQLATGIVCTCVVPSSRAEQFLPVIIMVSGVEVVRVEPAVTGCSRLRIDNMATFGADCAVGTE